MWLQTARLLHCIEINDKLQTLHHLKFHWRKKASHILNVLIKKLGAFFTPIISEVLGQYSLEFGKSKKQKHSNFPTYMQNDKKIYRLIILSKSLD